MDIRRRLGQALVVVLSTLGLIITLTPVSVADSGRIIDLKISTKGNYGAEPQISGNGRYVALFTPRGITVTDTKKKKSRIISKLKTDGNIGLAISHTGRYVAYEARKGVRRWDRRTGKTILLARDWSGTNGLAMSRSGRHYAFVDYDGAVVRLDARTGKRIQIAAAPPEEKGWHGSVAISGDGKTVAYWTQPTYSERNQKPRTCKLGVWRAKGNARTFAKLPNRSESCGAMVPHLTRNGRLLTFPADRKISDWIRINTRTGKRTNIRPPVGFSGCKVPAFWGSLSDNGKYLTYQVTGCSVGTTGYTTSTRLWKIGSPKAKTIFKSKVKNPDHNRGRPAIAAMPFSISEKGNAVGLSIGDYGDQWGNVNARAAVWRR